MHMLAGVAGDLTDLNREDEDDRPADTQHLPPGLIVVASLLNKAPNIAGLSRTCEVIIA